jgi:hypothetical protein
MQVADYDRRFDVWQIDAELSEGCGGPEVVEETIVGLGEKYAGPAGMRGGEASMQAPVGASGGGSAHGKNDDDVVFV